MGRGAWQNWRSLCLWHPQRPLGGVYGSTPHQRCGIRVGQQRGQCGFHGRRMWTDHGDPRGLLRYVWSRGNQSEYGCGWSTARSITAIGVHPRDVGFHARTDDADGNRPPGPLPPDHEMDNPARRRSRRGDAASRGECRHVRSAGARAHRASLEPGHHERRREYVSARTVSSSRLRPIPRYSTDSSRPLRLRKSPFLPWDLRPFGPVCRLLY